MAHIYMTFDFGSNEEKAQQARHKLDGWKQAFRLDKRLIYKFERPAAGVSASAAEVPPVKKEVAKTETPKKGPSEKGGKATGPKAKEQKEKEEEPTAPAAANGPVKLHLRLAFSGHEKITEERW